MTEGGCQGSLGIWGMSAGVLSGPGAWSPQTWSTLCREKPVWKALLGRLAPSAHRGPPGNLGQMACVGSPALW